MPRRRMVDPDFWNDSRIKKLSFTERLFFLGMINHADDEGRLLADPAFLRARIFPYDDFSLEDTRVMLDHILKINPNLQLYQNDGENYLSFRNWSRYQKPSHPQPSKLPPPSQFTESPHHEDGEIPGTSPSQDRLGRDSLVIPKGGRCKTPSPQEESETEVCDGEPLPTVKSEHKDERGEQTPAKKQKGSPDPRVGEVFAEMKSYLGYPDSISKDPIPSYGKEGRAIRRMLDRGFTREEVMACWKEKVDAKSGYFVSMTWVNEDVGKKGGHNGARNRGHKGRWSRELPPKYTPTPEYDD